MPERLTVFGCVPLPVSADDLTLPAFLAVILRFLPLIGSAILLGLGLHFSSSTAGNNNAADIVLLSLTLAICIISQVLYFALFKVSGKGDMLAYKQRTKPTLVVYHLLTLMYWAEAGCLAFGIALLIVDEEDSSEPLFIIKLIIVLGIALDLIAMGCTTFVLALLSRGKKPRKLQGKSYSHFLFGALKLLSYACCGFFGSLPATAMESELVWSEISHVVHAFLKDSLMDFTATDLLCALILVRMEQQESERNKVRLTQGSQQKAIRYKSQAFPSARTSPEALEVLRDFDEFAPYMAGIYGWKLAAFTSPWAFIKTIPKLLHRKLLGDGAEIEYAMFQHTIGDNLDHTKRQVLFSSFTSYLNEAVPYTITVDHEKRAVVISVRGTMSVSDIALDLMCEPATLQHAEKNWGVKNGSKHYVHGGMLRVASRIRADIDKQQILHRLFRKPAAAAAAAKDPVNVTEEDRESFLKAMGRSTKQGVTEDFMYQPNCYVNAKQLDALDCSEYRLICCGHSLGSCMAAILSLLLRDEFPRVHCLAYSCVSSIFSLELAEQSKEFISSITLGKDIFGRLSWRSMATLREQVLEMIQRCRVNKFTVMTSFFRPHSKLQDYLYAKDAMPDTEERRKVAAWIKLFGDELEKKDEENLLPIQRVPMFMPGKVFYLEKVSTELLVEKRCCCLAAKRSTYQSTEIMDRAQIQELHITSRLLMDHMPDTLAYTINQCLHGQGNNAQIVVAQSLG